MTLRRFAQLLFVTLVTASLWGARSTAQQVPPLLGIEGDHFTVNGTPKFLLFVSYFDALRRAHVAPATLITDLDFFKTRVDGIRIFPNWLDYDCDPDNDQASDGLFNQNGINEGRWDDLKGLLDAAGARGMIVDLTFTRDTVSNGQNTNGITEALYQDLVVNITNRMKNDPNPNRFRHVYFDLHNEWDWPHMTEQGLRNLALAVHAADPNRIVLASGAYVSGVSLDAAAPHPARDSVWFTLPRANEVVGSVRQSFAGPVHFQEPMPFTAFCPGQDQDGDAEHHKAAARNASRAGAAAWTLHNRVGFKLDSGTSFETLAGPALVHTLTQLRGGLTENDGSGTPCWGAAGVWSVSPTSIQVGAAGAAGLSVQAISNGGCPISLNPVAPALWIMDKSVQGQSLSFRVSANHTASPRVGSIVFAGRTIQVTQAQGRVPNDFNHDGLTDIGIFRPSDGLFFIPGQANTAWGGPGDMPVSGDFNGDGTPDIAVFRPWNGTWYVYGGETAQFGWPGDIPAPGDYDGNGTTDMAVFRPSTGTFFIRNIENVALGAAGDLPAIGDYNGDGRDDLAVYRPSDGTWRVRNAPVVQFGLPADLPVPADYNGDGVTEIAVFRPSTGQWFRQNLAPVQFGLAADVPIPLDRNGDGRAELGLFRRTNGTWYFKDLVMPDPVSVTSEAFGLSGDVPLGRAMPLVQTSWGDYDGDRKADVTVFRPSTGEWLSINSSNALTSSTQFGLNGDIPVGRDYDGDGRIDLAVYRPSEGRWYVRQSSNSATVMQDLGLASDKPVAGDYDGDGKADFAVFQPSLNRWLVRPSTTGIVAQYNWDQAGDLPVPADYDGEGRTDVAVFRPSTGEWRILNRFTGSFVVHQWGLPGDVPAAADFDGDSRADLAIYRPSTGQWFIKWSSDGSSQVFGWGLNGDIPVPADFNGDGKADVAVYRPSTGVWHVRLLFDQSWGLSGDIPALRNP